MFFLMLEALESKTDREIIGNLYHKYSSFVKFFVYKNFREFKTDANDIVNDVFVLVIKHKRHFISQDDYEYKRLFIIYTRSVCINLYNKRKREYKANKLFYEELTEKEAMPSDETLEQVIKLSEIDMLAEALEHLPPLEKDILTLKYYNGHSGREIADIVGLTESNVNVIVYRSLRKMRGQLEDYYEE